MNDVIGNVTVNKVKGLAARQPFLYSLKVLVSVEPVIKSLALQVLFINSLRKFRIIEHFNHSQN